jgi:hypothetical protein
VSNPVSFIFVLLALHEASTTIRTPWKCESGTSRKGAALSLPSEKVAEKVADLAHAVIDQIYLKQMKTLTHTCEERYAGISSHAQDLQTAELRSTGLVVAAKPSLDKSYPIGHDESIGTELARITCDPIKCCTYRLLTQIVQTSADECLCKVVSRSGMARSCEVPLGRVIWTSHKFITTAPLLSQSH